MTKIIGKTFFGRPQFFETQNNDQAKTPLFKNHSINRLRPSSFDPYSTFAKIHRLFLKIMSFLITITKPSAVTFHALVTDASYTQKDAMISLFKQCLSDDGHHITPFQQYEKLLKEVQKLKHTKGDPDHIAKEKIKFRKAFSESIKTLKDGQQLLLPLTVRDDVHIFYLLQKKGNSYSLKVIGCDQWMANISAIPTKKIGGKEKILSQIAFQNIPESYFTDGQIAALFHDPLVENVLNTTEVKSLLDEIPSECRIDLADREELWVTKSTNSRKALAFITEELGIVKGVGADKTNRTRIRFEFQTRLVALFDFFKQSRFYLERGTDYNDAMRYLIQEVAKEATLLGAKGVLDKGDLEEIEKELNFIAKTVKRSEESAKTSSVTLGKSHDLKFSSNSKIQAPLEFTIEHKSFESRDPKKITEEMPIESVSLLSTEEKKVLLSEDADKAVELIEKKTNLVKEWVQKDDKELAAALIMELAFNLGLERLDMWSTKEEDKTWHKSVSIEQGLKIQGLLVELSQMLVDDRKNGTPLPNRSIAMIQLMSFSAWLELPRPKKYKEINGERIEVRTTSDDMYPLQQCLDHFLQEVFNKDGGSGKGIIPHDLQRPFYLVDEENSKVVSRFLESLRRRSFSNPSPENIEISQKYIHQQVELFLKSFGVTATHKEFRDEYEFPIASKAFQPQQMLQWSKGFKNPLFLSALRQMSLQSNLVHVALKLYREGKLKYKKDAPEKSISLSEDPNVKGWDATEEEIKEMQKDFDRTESMKLPEASGDDPLRIFEKQLDDLQERMKEYGEEKQFTPEKIPLDLNKEELTDLLFLLRKDSPQLEAVGFMKTHPHLLANPDVRNYLEIVLFDMGGSSMEETLEENKKFVETLPSILKQEAQRYIKLVKTEPAYYDHLLFILSITRKFKGVFQAQESKNITKNLIKEFDEILQELPLDTMLADSSLSEYHYRASFESLMNKMANPSDLTEIIRLYHLLPSLTREAHDVDPNEVDKLSRQYATLLHSMKNVKMKSLEPLLDSLCVDRKLKLDSSSWKGSFPIFTNDQYQINLMKGEILDCSSGATLVALPNDVINHPAFLTTFGSLDKESMQVKAVKREEITVYLVSDKKGEQGRVEIEKGFFRFFKNFNEKKQHLQVIPLTGDDNLHALHCIAGEAIYIDSAKPQEGLCLDEKGNTRFKVNLENKGQVIHVSSVIDCRGEKESSPYAIQTLAQMTGLESLKQFENGKDILAFSQNGILQKIEFVRYGLSFTYKEGKFYSDEIQNLGYFIDLDNTWNGLQNALVLRHKDSSMPAKAILPDMSVFESKTGMTLDKPSFLQKFWLFFKAWWTKDNPDFEQFQHNFFVKGPQHTKDTILKPHLFLITPYTEELVPLEDKKRIESGLALISNALFENKPRLALTAFRQMKLTQNDLTKDKIAFLLNFLKADKNDDGNSASIKIQLALKIKNIIGKKVQFSAVSRKLSELISAHCETYLRQGRRINQQLLLHKGQFDLVGKIVQKSNNTFFEQHMRVFFLKEGDKLPKFNSKDGTLLWKDEIDLKKQIMEGKEDGLHGLEEISIESLEKGLKNAPYQETKGVIALEEKGIPLLYKEEELDSYFASTLYTLPKVILKDIESKASSCEKKSVEKLKNDLQAYEKQVAEKKQYTLLPEQANTLKIKIDELKRSFETKAFTCKQKVETLLNGNGDSIQGLAIKAGLQKVASFQELSLAFMQKDLKSLKDNELLPSNLDLDELKIALQEYFDSESKNLLLLNASKIMKELLDTSLSKSECLIKSNALHQLLSTKRFYSAEKNPEILVYECLTQKVLRQFGEKNNQIHIVEEMLKNLNGVFQAVTGFGKTEVASVLRGLLQANGTNLVTFRMLPTLFEQSLGILQRTLGDSFNKKIYALQFNLDKSPVIREKRKGDEVIEHSLFKKIYQDLLVTIQSKGCVLTDYKSIPLLQGKWVKLNRELLARRNENALIPDIEKGHWEYLRKILILVGVREETLMDEFDVPNRSRNRLQIPLGKPVSVAPFLYEKTLVLYEKLIKDERLKLAKDQQKDVFKKVGQEVIGDLAKEMAEGDKDLLDYFLGKSEPDLSKYSDAERDVFALYKDQFCIFLPLSLQGKNHGQYARSKDGKRTVPCHNGEPQENSRFGHPLEEINYMIQDYIQEGVSLTELSKWIKDLQADSMKSEISAELFADIFPKHSFPKEKLNTQQLKLLLKELNGNWNHVRHFLELKLKELSVSGEVISMTPHDSAAMPKAISGISATIGCLEELPKGLQMNKGKENTVNGEMVYRLVKRAKQKDLLVYDPETPSELFKKGKFNAVIDGAGAYRAKSSRKISKEFLDSQKQLEQVGYYEEKVTFVGESNCSLENKGFYFSKAKSRGANIPLDPQAEALLYPDEDETLEELEQNEGRMRLEEQKIWFARSIHNPGIKEVEDLLVHCARNEGQKNATGLFRSKTDEIAHLVRQKAYEEHLEIDDLDKALTQFGKWESLFITKPPHDYNKAGSYYAQNRQIRKVDAKPEDVLEEKKKIWLKKAESLGLQVDSLEKQSWDINLLEKMPSLVAGGGDTASIGIEVQEEVEALHEVEQDVEVEKEEEIEEEVKLDQCGDVPFYPPWIKNKPKEYRAAEWFHSAFDKRINFSENFLPVERKDSLFKRTPFDHAMQKIKTIHVVYDYNNKCEKIIVGDVLDDVIHRPYDYDYKKASLTQARNSFSYDLRTRKIIAGGREWDDYNKIISNKDFLKIVAQTLFINGEFEGYLEEEWDALCEWLKGLENPEEMRQFFQETILRTKPRKAVAFKKSPLYKFFDTLKDN